jgi:hypothetical protein
MTFYTLKRKEHIIVHTTDPKNKNACSNSLFILWHFSPNLSNQSPLQGRTVYAILFAWSCERGPRRLLSSLAP